MSKIYDMQNECEGHSFSVFSDKCTCILLLIHFVLFFFSYYWYLADLLIFALFRAFLTIRPRGHTSVQKEAWISVRFSNGFFVVALIVWFISVNVSLDTRTTDDWFHLYVHIFEIRAEEEKSKLINLIIYILQQKLRELSENAPL